MRTQYYTACSLDGFLATPDDSLEWLFPLGDIADTGYPDFIREVGALAMDSIPGSRGNMKIYRGLTCVGGSPSPFPAHGRNVVSGHFLSMPWLYSR